MAPSIILVPTEGFCNRLRAMASAYILAKYLKSKFYLIWEKEECCNCDWKDIFVTTFEHVDMDEVKRSKYYYSPNTHTNAIMNRIHEFDYIVIKGGHEFKHPDIPMLSFIQQKQRFYKSLRFTEAVQRVTNISDTFDIANSVGIHFRDYIPKFDASDNRMFSEVSPIESFMKLIKKVYDKDKQTVFFVSSNTNTALAKIRECVPEENIRSISELDTSRDTSTGVICAVANLLCLSQCKYIIGTLMSSYSDEACFFNLISKICIGNERNVGYHCHGYSEIWNHKMLLPNVNILYDIYKEEEKNGEEM